MKTGEYLMKWIAKRAATLAPRTVDGYTDTIRIYYLPEIGETELQQLTGEHIEAMLCRISSQGKTRTAELAYTVLRKALADAVREKLLTRSPMESVSRPKHRGQSFQWLTADQIAAYMRAAMQDPLRIAWMLGLFCGLRRGEIVGLRWKDVDLERKTISIRNQRQAIRGKGVLDLKPKSDAGIRTIPLPDDLVSLLLLEWRSAGYVICKQNGTPYTPSGLDQAHRRMILRYKLPDVTPHGLRTTCGAQGVTADVHVRVLQSILGHASYTTTARFYAKVDTSAAAAGIDKIARLMVKYGQIGPDS